MRGLLGRLGGGRRACAPPPPPICNCSVAVPGCRASTGGGGGLHRVEFLCTNCLCAICSVFFRICTGPPGNNSNRPLFLI